MQEVMLQATTVQCGLNCMLMMQMMMIIIINMNGQFPSVFSADLL